MHLKQLTASIAYRHPPLLLFGNKFIWQVAGVGRKIPLKIYPGSECRELGKVFRSFEYSTMETFETTSA